MEAFIGIVVATPLTIDDVTTTARRKRTAGMEQGSTFIRRYSRVGIRTAVAVGKVTERLLFKIIPRKGTTNLILEVGFGNPVNKLFCVIEVRTPGNILGNIQLAGRYCLRWPIEGLIPVSSTALACLTVKASHAV